MNAPQFTPEEAALLARLLLPQDGGNMYAAAYLVPSALLVAFGFVRSEPAAFAAAFAVIAVFTVWALRWQARSAPLLRSILQKYAAAVAQTPQH
ncbi:hypothetical protein [Tahibacter caeni]|uniref:hypothetical protein n=1 Tax=Tahibacter caeni TaxID=1453545 RepID=UPI002148BD01|nr:hypothetical protein [Tahibacter caeni]